MNIEKEFAKCYQLLKKMGVVENKIEFAHHSYEDDWGFGQRNLKDIFAMIKTKKVFGFDFIDFWFRKKVSGRDDDWNFQSILADPLNMFVFPIFDGQLHQECGPFWEKVKEVLESEWFKEEWSNLTKEG